jgi:hypothetical protein
MMGNDECRARKRPIALANESSPLIKRLLQMNVYLLNIIGYGCFVWA